MRCSSEELEWIFFWGIILIEKAKKIILLNVLFENAYFRTFLPITKPHFCCQSTNDSFGSFEESSASISQGRPAGFCPQHKSLRTSGKKKKKWWICRLPNLALCSMNSPPVHIEISKNSPRLQHPIFPWSFPELLDFLQIKHCWSEILAIKSPAWKGHRADLPENRWNSIAFDLSFF